MAGGEPVAAIHHHALSIPCRSGQFGVSPQFNDFVIRGPHCPHHARVIDPELAVWIVTRGPFVEVASRISHNTTMKTAPGNNGIAALGPQTRIVRVCAKRRGEIDTSASLKI